MAKLIVQHDGDPGIAIVLEPMPKPGFPEADPIGWVGTCTECGWPMFRWREDRAMESAQAHVDGHESAL